MDPGAASVLFHREGHGNFFNLPGEVANFPEFGLTVPHRSSTFPLVTGTR
jgi:hypothetical protein